MSASTSTHAKSQAKAIPASTSALMLRPQSLLLQRKAPDTNRSKLIPPGRSALGLQAKLVMGQPGDAWEVEADRAAEAVMSGDTANVTGGSTGTRVQRDEPQTGLVPEKDPTQEEKYKAAVTKLVDAFRKTPEGKALEAKAGELGDEFLSSTEGKVVTGTVLASALTAIIASNSELPIPIPELPLDFISPGLKAKLTWDGPVRTPTNVSLTITTKGGISVGAGYSQKAATETNPAEQRAGLTLSFPLGGTTGKAKNAGNETDRYKTQTARLAAEQAKMSEGMKSADERAQDDAFWQSYWRSKLNDPLNPLRVPGGAAEKKTEDVPVMRKVDHSETIAEVPASVHETLNQAGAPLDRETRDDFESRFGQDFSSVRIHTDAQAGASARAVGALAYTVGNHVVFGPQEFRPQTDSGRRLMAHEFAHVVQQTGSRPVTSASGTVQRQPAPAPARPQAATPRLFYQDAVDALQQAQANPTPMIAGVGIDFITPLEKLVALCEAIDHGVKADVTIALTDFLAVDEYHLPLATPSNDLAAEMISRMLALGLEAESQKLRQWSLARDKRISPAFHEGYSAEIFMWERIEERLLAQIPETGGANALKSIETLLLFFKQLHQERVGLDADEIKKDQKRRADNFDNYFVQRDRTISVYAGELVRLMRETFIGTQSAFQVMLDEAQSDLATGKSDTMLKMAKSALSQLFAQVAPEDLTQSVAGVPVETTHSEFKEGGGRHVDFFAKTPAAKNQRSVKFNFYDKDQMPSMASEMKSELGAVLVARERQIALLEEIFGLQKDDQGKLTAETVEDAAAVKKLGKDGLRLESDDDWRKFVTEKFELHEAKEGAAKALTAVIVLLEKYLKIFTTHTPYNIEDFGDNLLKKKFPRDLAGRLIHDCGVYALRAAYILSLLRDHPKLKLRFRYEVMPLHVGLIITGENLPLFLVNNDTITRYEPSDVAAMKNEWNKLDETGEVGTPVKPATEERFVGEVMADAFISGVDLPYKEIDVQKTSGSPGAMKAQLWQQYTTAVAPSADKLFDPSVKDSTSPNYQFYLRYLKLLDLLKAHHNQSIVPFWNVKAKGAWLRHKADIVQAFANLQKMPAGAKEKKAYADAVKGYTDEIDPLFQELEDSFKPIEKEESEMMIYLGSHPHVFAAGAEVESSDRVHAMFRNLGQQRTWWETRVHDHLSDLRSGLKIAAPFEKPEDLILPIN